MGKNMPKIDQNTWKNIEKKVKIDLKYEKTIKNHKKIDQKS